MILWGIGAGALLGWVVAEFEGYGLILGAMAGFVAGLLLRRAVRSEVDRATAVLREALEDQIDLVRRAQIAAPAPAAAPAVAAAPAEPALVAPELPAETETAPAPQASGPPPIGFRPVAAREPREPGVLARGFAAARAWLFGGNTIVRVGLVILFVGLSFLARYAAMAGLFPIELRLALVGGFGIALLGTGFSRRRIKPDFALALQGAGVAVLYLTIFGAARLFELVPLLPAFAIMVIVCALGCALALLQNSQSLAVAAFAGGFAVPVLLGGDGSSIGLFGYYAVLNLAVLFIAQQRSWRLVNLISFFATFGVATAWGVLSYTPAEYATSQAFLILFVAIYVLAAILHARNTPGRLGNVVDSTLLFGPALVGFGLQVGLVRHLEYGNAFAALGFGALYIVLAGVMVRNRGAGFRLLFETMLAIGVGFATLAVPLALGARWTSSVWAIEGAGAFWVGMRQERWLPRAFGLALIGVAGLVFLGNGDPAPAALPLLGPATVGAVLIAASALGVAWWLRQPIGDGGSRWAASFGRIEAVLGTPTFLFGFGFWCIALVGEITRVLPPALVDAPRVAAIVPALHDLLIGLGFIASAGVAAIAARRTGWRVAGWPMRAILPVLVLMLVARIGDGHHVVDLPDLPAWGLALGLHYRLLWQADRTPGRWQRWVHVGSVWLLTALLADALGAGIEAGRLWNTSWAGVVMLVAAVAVLVALAFAACGTRWPLVPHAPAYGWTAALPIAALVYAGTLATALLAAGRTDPLPYLPLLNPVDLACGLALGGLMIWQRGAMRLEPLPAGAGIVAGREAMVALALLAFVVVNTVWLRLAHHWLGVAWSPEAMLGNSVVQTGLAILWTLLALALMLVAHRRGQRALWLAGAGLLGAVVVKLLLIDLSSTAGGERIIAFIVVGLLMLVVGYFVPLPPRASDLDAGEAKA